MSKFHKILFLGAAISCLAILPGKESCAQDTTALPQELTSEVEAENTLELYNDDSVFIKHRFIRLNIDDDNHGNQQRNYRTSKRNVFNNVTAQNSQNIELT